MVPLFRHRPTFSLSLQKKKKSALFYMSALKARVLTPHIWVLTLTSFERAVISHFSEEHGAPQSEIKTGGVQCQGILRASFGGKKVKKPRLSGNGALMFSRVSDGLHTFAETFQFPLCIANSCMNAVRLHFFLLSCSCFSTVGSRPPIGLEFRL